MSSYDETAKRGFLSRFLTWKLARRLVIVGAILGLLLFLAVVIWFAALNRSLPTVANLKQYEPPITSRVHAGDGSLIAEFADEHRVFVPYESIPQHVIDAFVAAEDKKFFEHGGIDYMGMTRGVMRSARNKILGSGGLQGGSTITQQVAKNMLLTSDQTITRKAKEALLAWKMEDAFSKEKIIELYLNEIYLGSASGKRSFGVGFCCAELLRQIAARIGPLRGCDFGLATKGARPRESGAQSRAVAAAPELCAAPNG